MSSFDQVPLPDGRHLDARISGPDGGRPLVFHHGTPGAAVPVRAFERAAHGRGWRLVTYSRPGYGGSSRDAGRTVVSAVADTRAVLDYFGITRCVVAGWSGGGPHALASAARLDGAAAALIIAGVAPFAAEGLDWLAGMGQDNLDEFGATLEGEAPLRAYLDAAREELKEVSAADIVTSMGSLLPPVDRAALTDEFGDDLAASFHEGLRLGVDGWLDDDRAFVAPWGFDLGDISIPTMVWQGSADLMVPFAHGQWLARRLPGASAHLLDGEGHLSVGIGRFGEMLDELAAAAE